MKQNFVILRKTPTKTRAERCAFSVWSFPRRGIFQGTPLLKCRGFTFPARAADMRQIGGAYRKARLSDAQEIVCIVHTFSFVLTKEKVVRKGEPCRALARKFARHTGGGFSPLRRAFQGSRLKNARRIHLHPYAHKGKEAKASFCLFLSICME